MSGILIKLELFILDFQNVVPISKEMSTQSLKEHGWLKGFSMQKRGLFFCFSEGFHPHEGMHRFKSNLSGS